MVATTVKSFVRAGCGLLHMVLESNVHGIERMPFGVVVFTGLAHMRSNVGALYLVSQAKDGTVEAAPFRPLAGAPTEVMRTSAGELVFMVYTDRFEKKGDHLEPVLDCYRLTKMGDVSPLSCSSIVIFD